MARQSGLFSQTLRLGIAFGVFVVALCGLLYLGFEVKFQPADFYSKPTKSTKQDKNAQAFYKTVGGTTQGAGIAELSKPNNLGRKFTLELGAAKSKQEAEQEVDRLIARGIQAYYTPVHVSGQVIYRIRQGIFETTQRASLEAAQLKQKNINARVIELR